MRSFEFVSEKAVSKKQQQFFGIVRAMQKGDMKKGGEAGEVAKDMKVSDVKDFAKTKHKGLPAKKKSEGYADDQREKTKRQLAAHDKAMIKSAKKSIEKYEKNKNKNEEAAGVGIVTKQNATADVPVGGEYMNVKKLFPKNKKKKTKEDNVQEFAWAAPALGTLRTSMQIAKWLWSNKWALTFFVGAWKTIDWVGDALNWVEKFLDHPVVKSLTKYGLPAVGVAVALYGGAKLYRELKGIKDERELEKMLRSFEPDQQEVDETEKELLAIINDEEKKEDNVQELVVKQQRPKIDVINNISMRKDNNPFPLSYKDTGGASSGGMVYITPENAKKFIQFYDRRAEDEQQLMLQALKSVSGLKNLFNNLGLEVAKIEATKEEQYTREQLPQIKNKHLDKIRHTVETIEIGDIIPVQEQFIFENFKKQIDSLTEGNYKPIIVDCNNKIINGHHRYAALQMLGETDVKVAKLFLTVNAVVENFADGKKKGKSRPGRVKKSGASCNGSVSELRKKAKNAGGEKGRMYHWCANMKSGRKKGK